MTLVILFCDGYFNVFSSILLVETLSVFVLGALVLCKPHSQLKQELGIG